KLKPGGYHVMLIDLKRPLVPGEKLPIKLMFEKAGEVTVEAKIKDKGMPAGH
ncbi:MAG: copper chaperone PCu(A)C, partial [Fluviibacter sp.]